MIEGFKPMLADSVDNVNLLSFPLYASPKLDGIRAVVIDGVLLSRNLKPIPNKHVQKMFGDKRWNGLDGELICGDPGAKDAFRATTKAVMSIEGTPDVRFYVFDDFSHHHGTFKSRQEQLNKRALLKTFQRWPSTIIETVQALNAFEEDCLKSGFEGVMIRSASGPYKFGRSTLREGHLLKLKQFEDGEAEVIGIEEQMHNGNVAEKDNLGRTKRSTHKAGKSGLNTLGALVVRDIKTKVEFNIGSGFDAATRRDLWELPPLGKIVKYRYFPTGSKDKPRFPVFVGFRDKRDM